MKDNYLLLFSHWMFKTIKVIFLCFLLSMCGCIFHQQYPADWAPLVTISNGCPNISGTYVDRPAYRIPSLSNILIEKWVGWGKLDKATHVEIINSNNDLKITAWNDDVLIASKTYKKDDYTCSDDGIQINMVEATAENVVGVYWGKIILRKAVDNSLVIRSEGGFAGLGLLIIPLVGHSIEYYGYPAKK